MPDPIDTDELRPCPFCGTTEMLRRIGAAPGSGWSFVRCDYCDAEGPDPENFPGGWNARAREAELQAEVDRLRVDRDQGAKDYCDLMGQRDALHVRVKTLEAALRPFVAYVHDDLRKGKATYELVAVDRAGGGLIGAEDLRRARASLNPTGD